MKFGSPVRASIFAEGLAGGGAGGLDGGIAAAGVATAAACGCDLPTAGWAAREGFERICARGTFRLPQPYGGAYTIWAIYARRFDNRPSEVPRVRDAHPWERRGNLGAFADAGNTHRQNEGRDDGNLKFQI